MSKFTEDEEFEFALAREKELSSKKSSTLAEKGSSFAVKGLSLPFENPITRKLTESAGKVGDAVENITGVSRVGERIATSPKLAFLGDKGRAFAGTVADMTLAPLPYALDPKNQAINIGMAMLPGASVIEKNVIQPRLKQLGKSAIEKTGDVAGKVSEKLISSSLKLKPTARKEIISPYVAGKTPEKWLLENNIKAGTPEYILEQLDDMASKSKSTVDSILENKKGSYKFEPAKQALDELDEMFKDTRGNEEIINEIKSLKNKATPPETLKPFQSPQWQTEKEQGMSLKDLNRVKRLIDKHENLFEKSGDPKIGAKATGLLNIRQKIQSFIESKAPAVKALNKRTQVATKISRAIADKEISSANNNVISLTDYLAVLGATGGAIAVGPVGSAIGAGTVLVGKRILSSPTFKIRFASALNKLPKSDLSILESTIKGKPTQLGKSILDEVIKKSSTSLPVIKDNKKLGLPPLK